MLQDLSDCGVEKRLGGGAVCIAGGESWDDGWTVHMDATEWNQGNRENIKSSEIFSKDWQIKCRPNKVLLGRPKLERTIAH